MEHVQRDRELIIFGLPNIPREDRTVTAGLVASCLGINFSPSDVATSLRIRSGRPGADPLILQFTTEAHRNEWLVASRGKRDLVAAALCSSWGPDPVRIFERATAAERKLYNQARTFAVERGIRSIWMRRGVVFFRLLDGSGPFRYETPASFDRALSSVPSTSALSGVSCPVGESI